MRKVFKKLFPAVLLVAMISLFATSCFLPGNKNGNEDDTCPVIILQVYGSGSATDGAVSASFIELYNTSDKDFNLDGFSVQVADGASQANPEVSDWKVKSLNGYTIKARSSFTIKGKNTNSEARLQLSQNDADLYWDIQISNRSFKVALIQNTVKLNHANPFDTDGNGTKVPGYVDMVGAVNDPEFDSIDGYETSYVQGVSKQKSVRRRTLMDTDENSFDFAIIDYRETGINDTKLEIYRPKNQAYGAWDPEYAGGSKNYHELAGKVMILQAAAASSDGAISNSFIELYNFSDQDVSLNGLYIQYSKAEGTSWNIIPLGNTTIKAKTSLLILGNRANPNARLLLENSQADLVASFSLDNRGFKVCLISSNTALTYANPFDTDGQGKKATGYVDMLGAVNDPLLDAIDGYETAPVDGISKQKSARRLTVYDSDDNSEDFMIVDYRETGVSAGAMANLMPKNQAYGKWNPITFQKFS